MATKKGNLTVEARWFNGKKESNESIIRRFKRKSEKSELLYDLKKHEFYVKPSVKRKLKSKLARQRRERDERKLQAKLQSKDK